MCVSNDTTQGENWLEREEDLEWIFQQAAYQTSLLGMMENILKFRISSTQLIISSLPQIFFLLIYKLVYAENLEVILKYSLSFQGLSVAKSSC